MDFHTQSHHVLAGFFESSAYCLRRFLDDVQRRHGITLRRIAITGELTQWDSYNQFLSDVVQLPLHFFGKEMLGIKGAGYLLGNELNFFSNSQLLQMKRTVLRQYVPQIDPLSSYATYSQWLEFASQGRQFEMV
jgi:glycerol kinase